jgi:hypothetical protein
MGQIIINFSYFIINSPFLIKEKISEIFCPKKKNKHSYIPMEFDDDIEEHATIMTSEEINSMIQNQKNNEEYKIIKNKDDEDVNLKKDIDLIKEEVKQIDIENNNNNNENNSDDEDLDKIKKELLNNNDEE